MSEAFPTEAAEFDRYAAEYDAALANGLAASGEEKEYFAQGRVNWLTRCVEGEQASLSAAMDFGCGTGSATPFLLRMPGVTSLVGVDVSANSLAYARRSHPQSAARFALFSEYKPEGVLDLAFCNGVFHHIPVAERDAAVQYIYRSLRPGGVFAFWENNPWNPGTRYVMSRIPFDRNAITLKPREAQNLVRRNGFVIMRTDYLFIFPRVLRWLRGLEPRLAVLPLGAQYQVLCRKP